MAAKLSFSHTDVAAKEESPQGFVNSLDVGNDV